MDAKGNPESIGEVGRQALAVVMDTKDHLTQFREDFESAFGGTEASVPLEYAGAWRAAGAALETMFELSKITTDALRLLEDANP